MKGLLLVFIIVTLTSCSFDNKTGIWKDATNTPVDYQTAKSINDNKQGSRYEDVFIKNKVYDEEKKSLNFSKILISAPVKITNWFEQYAIQTNNISNFYYSGNKALITKSRKLSKHSFRSNYESRKIVFYKNNLITYDHRGTIFIYSLSLNKKIFKYNFYKKKFKNFNKEINFIINENILYVSDNLGYLYALNLDDNTIIWAKNYGIPFRSNLKFENKEIFLANQDNVIYAINAKTGNKNWQFPTRLTYLKSDFENNFALDVIYNNLFFLNTSGELYSINYLTQNINWVINFKNSSLTGDSNIFFSQPIVVKDNNLIAITERAVLSYDTLTGKRNWSFSSKPIFKPIITLNYTYIVLKNNLLICLNNTDGTVIWSKNIYKNIVNKKILSNFKSIIDFKIVNSEINVYYKSGFFLSFNPKSGNLNSENRISKNGINSEIFFLNNNMLFVDNDNKLLKFN